MEARPRGTDWMTPQSKTISSDEKQIGVAGAGREAGGWQGPRENSGVPDMLCIFIMVTDTRVHLPAFVKIHPSVPFKRAHSILCKADLSKPKF